MNVHQWEESRWKDLLKTDMGKPKNQAHQIILAFDLKALKLTGILTIAFFQIHFDGEHVQ